MVQRTLARTGVHVSPSCLGAMMFGAWGETDHDACVRIIHRALDAGINLPCRTAALLDPRPRDRGRRAAYVPGLGMGVIPWSPLAGGWLSGRWRKGGET